jgi:hypothetical protein
MKKKIIVTMIVLASFLAGCSLVTQFQKAKDEFLETRVAEMLEEMPAEELEVEEPVEETTPSEEPTVEEETEETKEPEGTAEADETPEETEVPEEEPETEPEPTVESDDPAIYLGEADWIDEMETAEYWPTGIDEFTSAAFENGTLKLTALSETNGWRIASTPVLGNAYIEANVKMGTCRETDGYGFIFRVPKDTGYNKGYLFGITCDGRYSLRMWDGLTGESGLMLWLKYYTISEWINEGANQSNRIGVMALDNRFILYVNGEKVDEIIDDDNTYAEGFFGLYVNRDKTENLAIVVDKVSYWTDPQEK